MRVGSKNKRSRSARTGALPWLLIAAGALMVLVAFGMKWSAKLEQEALLNEYAAKSASAQYDVLPGELPDPGAAAPAASPAPETDDPAQDGEQGSGQGGQKTPITPIAVLSIPKLDLRVAIGEGVDDHTLKYAVGHFPDTALAGQKGNFCLIGHRNYTFGEFFNRLDELESGDRVSVESGGATYTYVVTESFVVEPTDTWVLDSADAAEITLITCTPIRVATHRLIVKGVLE